MATPIKNGVNIFLPEYNLWLRADVYRMYEVFVFIGSSSHDRPDATIHAHVTISNEGMMRESEGYTLIVVPSYLVDRFHDWSIP